MLNNSMWRAYISQWKNPLSLDLYLTFLQKKLDKEANDEKLKEAIEIVKDKLKELSKADKK